MKIIFFQSQFKMGGQQKIVKTIAEELNKNYDVTVYYENHNFFDLSLLKLIRPTKWNQLMNMFKAVFSFVIRFNFNKRAMIDFWHLINVQSTIVGQKYDVVILSDPYILFVDEIRRLTSAKKIICWTHNLYENYTEDRFKAEKKQLMSSMGSADQIICLEAYTAAKWKQVNDNVIIINNPVTPVLRNASHEISTLNNKVVSFTGRIQVNSKGLDYLCEMAVYLDKGVTVEVAGSGTKKEERLFQRLIKQKKISDKVRWVGALSGKSLGEHYQKSSIFLMCSRYEGFPLVAAEAMSFGLPIVAFNIPSLREVTLNGTTGILVSLGNVKEMGNQINKLFQDTTLLSSYQKLSLERAKMLSIENIVKQWRADVLNLA
ncbi:MAG: glycosyltransferase [Oenococcus sp.]|uniref:glycosyltransferase n=1 Tax=Oenococcus sp. TaxID=1979414 RepID=UPI0039EBF3C8